MGMAFVGQYNPPPGKPRDPFFTPWYSSPGQNDYHLVVAIQGEWYGFPGKQPLSAQKKPNTYGFNNPEFAAKSPLYGQNRYCCCLTNRSKLESVQK
jgi:hypothetical protein